MADLDYQVPKDLIDEALNYAERSAAYTSDAHDFHAGGLNNKQQKMFEGKLGEKVFKLWLLEHDIDFLEDQSSHMEADLYDFLCNDLKIDTKTRTKSFHTRTLELVKQFDERPKDVYVSIFLDVEHRRGQLLGWVSHKDMQRKAKIENQGYRDNYVIYDHQLRHMQDLLPYLRKNNA